MAGTRMDRLRTKAAQVVFPRLGSNMPPPVRVSEDIDRFRPLQEKYQFGGIVLFNGDTRHTPALLADLQKNAAQPILVASDIERGAGQQIAGATLFPHARACANAGLEAVKNFAETTAIEALACGLHITFGPVADVNSNPQNPIIGIRAFGDNPADVQQHVRTYIDTCRRMGLLTTAKHFPGHGDTATDSHAMLPVVNRDEQALGQVEFPPFIEAINMGTNLIMTAHVAFPRLHDTTTPATLSAPILQGVLRQKLGFKGAVISDSLIMKAIQPADGDMARYAANLLHAGLDILLDPLHPVPMVEGIVEAVSSGILDEARLDEAIAQIDKLRGRITEKFGSGFFADPNQAFPKDLVGCNAHQEQAHYIAARAISADNPAKPATNMEGNKMAVFVTPYRTRLDPTEAPLGAALRQLAANNPALSLTYHEVDAETEHATFDKLIEALKSCNEAFIFVVSKPAAWHAYGLPDNLSAFVTAVTRTLPTTLVSLGDHHVLAAYPEAMRTFCAYSDVQASQEAAANAVLR